MKIYLKTLILTFVSMPLFASDMVYVTIGDPGNPADASGRGSVSYYYAISQTEVSIKSYLEFLNAVAKSDPNQLWTSSLSRISRTGVSGEFVYSTQELWENKPVLVNITKLLRYINWLHNDKPTGNQDNTTTEDGAYTFYGQSSYTLRNGTAKYWMPSENEWRKAAYYDPVTRSHRLYPHGSETPVTAVGNINGDVVNPSNKTYAYGNRIWGSNTSSAVYSIGTSGAHSPWGTLDQAGNAWEIFEPTQPGQTTFKGYGGAHNVAENDVSVMRRTFTGANFVGNTYTFGIRVAKAIEDPIDWANADDDNDGVSNFDEIRLGTNPSISNLELFNNIRNNPDIFGLYQESDIVNYNLRGFAARIDNNQVLLSVDVQDSVNLIDWNKAGEMHIQFEVDEQSKFYRLMIEK